MSKGLTSVIAMQSGGFFGDPGESPEAYSSDSFAGGTTNLVDASRPSGPEAAAGGPDPFDRPSSSESSEPKRSVNVEDFIGSGDEDQDQMIQQILATPEDERNWVEKRIAAQYEKDPSKLGEIFYDPERGDFTGYMSEAPFTGGLGGFLAALFGKQQGLVDGKRPKPMAYTGFGRQFIFDSDDDERAVDSRPAVPVPVVPAPTAEVEPVVSVPPSYYATGLGTGTMSLAELANVQPYLATLYASTPSPINQSYEDLLKRIKKQEKDRRRLSGLDIFKPVSTVK